MADIVTRYFDLDLKRFRATDLTEAQEDALLEQLDDLWERMTDAEQARCRAAAGVAQPATQHDYTTDYDETPT